MEAVGRFCLEIKGEGDPEPLRFPPLNLQYRDPGVRGRVE